LPHSHLICEAFGAVTESPNELFATFAPLVKARSGRPSILTISPWPGAAGTAPAARPMVASPADQLGI
jgi:hypothetical protein